MSFVSDTEPYPWPYDGHLDPAGLALVVCGAQRQLVDISTQAACVASRLAATATTIRQHGGMVIWLRHGRRSAASRATASLPVRESPRWSLVQQPATEDLIVDAAGWDGCFASDLDHNLRTMALRSIVLGGFASEITVDSTVRTLNDRGHECLVLTDACAPIDEAVGARAHHSITMSGGIFGAIGTTRALVDALDRIVHRTPNPSSEGESS